MVWVDWTVDKLYRAFRFLLDYVIGYSAVAIMLIGTCLAVAEVMRRYIFGLVFDWGLTGKNPVKLDWDRAHLFAFEPASARFMLLEPNIALVERSDACLPGNLGGRAQDGTASA